MRGHDRSEWGHPTRWALLLIWAGFTAAYLLFFYLFQDAREIADASLDGYLEVMLLAIPTVVLLGVVLWLRDATVDPDLRPRIVGWTVGLSLFFVVTIYTAVFVIESRFDVGEFWLIVLLSAGVGASAGSVMGIGEVRSKQRERERNLSVAVARRKERKRSQLEYLNQYLRHEVLNEVTKIHGYAGLVADEVDPDGTAAEHLSVIRDSSDEVAAFVESIRTILDATDHEPELTRVDVVSVADAEARAVTRTNPGVEVTVDASGPVAVLAGDLLGRVFRNLFENAVEHNGRRVSITVTVTRRGDWVQVGVRDDGTGIPAAKRDRLFEPPAGGDHGYGLFLVRNLVEVYGGRIDLGESGPEGTEFLVRFRAADATEGDVDPTPRSVATV
jgi:signal transduction histidine kinase